MQTTKLIFLFVSAILFSCTVPQGVTVDEKVEIGANYGLVLMSLSRSGFDVPYELYYKSKNNKNVLDATRIDLLDVDDWLNLPGQENDEIGGRLFVMKLPAGVYKFHDIGVEHGYSQAEWGGAGLYDFNFKVLSGEAVYIGNIHVHSSNIGNNDMEIESHTSISDKSDRDLPMFSSRYKNLKSFDISINLADGGKSKGYKRRHLGVEESIAKSR